MSSKKITARPSVSTRTSNTFTLLSELNKIRKKQMKKTIDKEKEGLGKEKNQIPPSGKNVIRRLQSSGIINAFLL